MSKSKDPIVRCLKVTNVENETFVILDAPDTSSYDISKFKGLDMLFEYPHKVGEKITYTMEVITMKQSERDAIPDFEGF